jgi:TPR repeat protein
MVPSEPLSPSRRRLPPWSLLALVTLLAAPASAADCPTLYEQARKTHEKAVSTAAVETCGKLAGKGDATGRYLFGMLKIGGIGTAKEPDAGLKLVREAADSGLPAAQARLGRMHLRGEGVQADPAAAAGWFERAALGGDPLAQYELGQLRYKGLGVKADPAEAYKWFSAAVHNFEQAGNVPRRKLAERKRETVAADLSDSDRAAAEAWLTEQPRVLTR